MRHNRHCSWCSFKTFCHQEINHQEATSTSSTTSNSLHFDNYSWIQWMDQLSRFSLRKIKIIIIFLHFIFNYHIIVVLGLYKFLPYIIVVKIILILVLLQKREISQPFKIHFPLLTFFLNQMMSSEILMKKWTYKENEYFVQQITALK
jgi:hypothetical protein